ncbi:MAG: hypothetical protein J2P13_01165 [Acidobacteria bacterium]|nr:hypothetical protein [Acidobacteriota bacterium]
MSKHLVGDLGLMPRALTAGFEIQKMETLAAVKKRSMEHFNVKNIIACMLVVALASCRMWADPGADQAHADAVKKKVVHRLDDQRRVVLETYDNRRLQGFIAEAGADNFVLSYSGQATTLLYRDVRTIKWQSEAAREVARQGKVLASVAITTAVLVGLLFLLEGAR